MNDLFLNAEQLVDLTGYQRAAEQIRWLQAAGIRHFVRADGKPRVPVAAVAGAGLPAPALPPQEPNFDGPRFRQ